MGPTLDGEVCSSTTKKERQGPKQSDTSTPRSHTEYLYLDELPRQRKDELLKRWLPDDIYLQVLRRRDKS
jgi:hypothetical protein